MRPARPPLTTPVELELELDLDLAIALGHLDLLDPFGWLGPGLTEPDG